MSYDFADLKKKLLVVLNESDEDLVDDVLDMVIGTYISAIAEHRVDGKFFDKDIERIHHIKKEPDIVTSDPLDAVAAMVYDARENSHGAASLAKVFMSEFMYSYIVEKAGVDIKAVCRILGVPIYPSKAVKTPMIYGVCRRKFKYLPAQQLVLIAKVPKFGE